MRLAASATFSDAREISSMRPSDKIAAQTAVPLTEIVANRNWLSSLVQTAEPPDDGLPATHCHTLPFTTVSRSPKVTINQPILKLGELGNQMTDLLNRLRDLIDDAGYRHNDRIPPERELCAALGTKRNQLRKALAELEAQGRIWRHVGRGTFVGSRPVLNLQDVTYLGDQIKPEHVVAVRFAVEPELCHLAAQHATRSDREQMLLCAQRCKEAEDWRAYEAWDNNLHHAIARASKNQLFLYFFETLNAVRRSIVWGQPRDTLKPRANHTSFYEHDVIMSAIASGDGVLAAKAMFAHLSSVYSRVLPDKDMSEFTAGVPTNFRNG